MAEGCIVRRHFLADVDVRCNGKPRLVVIIQCRKYDRQGAGHAVAVVGVLAVELGDVVVDDSEPTA